MRGVTATEDEIWREGIRAILARAGIDPERATLAKSGYTLEGKRYWIWTDGNEEDRDHRLQEGNRVCP